MTTQQPAPEPISRLPFGITFQPGLAHQDIKTNILLTELNGFELSRLQCLGFTSPRYEEFQSNWSIFTLNNPHITGAGFQLNDGVLNFCDQYGRTIVCTFDFILLLIAVSHSIPKVIKERAIKSVLSEPMSQILRYNSHHWQFTYLYQKIMGKSLGCTEPTLIPPYTPQSGTLSTCKSAAQAAAKLCYEETRTNAEPLAVLLKEKVKEFAGWLSMDVDVLSFAVCSMFVYLVFRIVTDLKLLLSFFVGTLTTRLLDVEAYKYKAKFPYGPQSGTVDSARLDQVKTASRLFSLAGTVLGAVVSIVTLLAPDRPSADYRPQAANLESDDGSLFTGVKAPKSPKTPKKPIADKPAAAAPGVTVLPPGATVWRGSAALGSSSKPPNKSDGPLNGFGVGI